MKTSLLTFATANGSMLKYSLRLRDNGNLKIGCRLVEQLVYYALIFRVGPGLLLPSHLRRPFCPLYEQTEIGLESESNIDPSRTQWKESFDVWKELIL